MMVSGCFITGCLNAARWCLTWHFFSCPHFPPLVQVFLIKLWNGKVCFLWDVQESVSLKFFYGGFLYRIPFGFGSSKRCKITVLKATECTILTKLLHSDFIFSLPIITKRVFQF